MRRIYFFPFPGGPSQFMDTAIEHFKAVLTAAIQTETAHFQSEISA